MGLFDWFTNTEPSTVTRSTDQEDYNIGIELLQAFHNRAKEYDAYKFSFEDLLNSIDNRPNIQQIKIQGIGLAYNVQDRDMLTLDEAKESMIALADMGAGQVPTTYQTYSNAIGKKAGEYSFMDAVTYTATETVKDLAVGAGKGVEVLESIGQGAINTGNIVYYASKILPVAIPIGLIAFAYFYFKKNPLNSILGAKFARNPKRQNKKRTRKNPREVMTFRLFLGNQNKFFKHLDQLVYFLHDLGIKRSGRNEHFNLPKFEGLHGPIHNVDGYWHEGDPSEFLYVDNENYKKYFSKGV